MLKDNKSFAVGGGSDLSTTVIAPSNTRNPNFVELGAGLIKDGASRNKAGHHSVDFKSVYKRSDSGIRSNVTNREQQRRNSTSLINSASKALIRRVATRNNLKNNASFNHLNFI